MPELMHYENEDLNKGFIFTNLQSIIVEKEDYNPNIIKHLKSVRKNIYKNLQLPSYYKSRVDFGDITSSFYKVMEKVFCEEFGIDSTATMTNIADNALKIQNKGMITEIKAYKEKLITDKKLESEKFDELLGAMDRPDDRSIAAKLADNDLQDVFNETIKGNLNGFAPKRSIPTVRGSIYQWFKKYLCINYSMENGIIVIQNLFLHRNNREKFSQLLSKSTGEYKPIKKEEVKKKIEETIYDWDINKEEFYNQHTDENVDHKLSIYEPCYLAKDRLTPEKEFETHLETKAEKIDWWYKNGINKKDFFGIKYVENDLPHTFYPDYIIQYKSGLVGIYDTKKGSTAKEAASRAETLQVYIKEQNKKGKNLIGGIVIKDNTNKWRVNKQDIYNYDPNNLTGWIFFDD